MKVDFKRSFTKDLKKIRDKGLLNHVKGAIEEIEQTSNLQAVSNLKQLREGNNYFRVKIKDYRIGLKVDDETVIFIRFLHRKDIYRYFP